MSWYVTCAFPQFVLRGYQVELRQYFGRQFIINSGTVNEPLHPVVISAMSAISTSIATFDIELGETPPACNMRDYEASLKWWLWPDTFDGAPEWWRHPDTRFVCLIPLTWWFDLISSSPINPSTSAIMRLIGIKLQLF